MCDIFMNWGYHFLIGSFLSVVALRLGQGLRADKVVERYDKNAYPLRVKIFINFARRSVIFVQLLIA